jgi:hypothetical protein
VLQNEQINQANQMVPGHKKSNSLMNQKMMQLLLTKEYGNNHTKNNKSIMVPQQMIQSHHIEPSKKTSITNNHQKINSQTFHVHNAPN